MTEGEISAQEMADDLGIETKKITFHFDSPVYAKAELVVRGGSDPGTALTMKEPGKTVSFSYIFRGQNITPLTKSEGRSMHISLGGGGSTYCFTDPLYDTRQGLGVHPEIALPRLKDSKKPACFVVFWMSDGEGVTDKDAPTEAIAKIKRGYYLVLYFSATPFK